MIDPNARGACPWIRSLCLAILLVGFGAPAASDDPSQDKLLLGRTYPLEASVAFPVALFHWVDSLAGTSGGKTVPAYRREFFDHFGAPSERDAKLLVGFRDARTKHAYNSSVDRSSGIPVAPRSALLGIFCESGSLEAALRASQPPLVQSDAEALRAALDHFRPRYERIWRDGVIARSFLENARKDGARKPLARLLRNIAAFYDVDLSKALRPHIVLVPVPHGHGTHAEAIGRHLLIEVRPSEKLADEASVIVHENAHFLFYSMEEDRERRLAASMTGSGAAGIAAWDTLREALPTALGQGVADRTFRPGAWSKRLRWYHTDEVDGYAKALYPLVDRALATGRRFDEAFLRDALALYPGADD
jgi:hypothetical protein